MYIPKTRISRKRVEGLCEGLGLTLITHQCLGNRKDYYYTYSITIRENGKWKETLVQEKSLKYLYEYLGNLYDDKEFVDKQIDRIVKEKYRY